MSQIIPEIVSQHAEEAAFLWLLRDEAVRAPHYSLADLARLDDRIEAHLDGLRVAGEEGAAICRQELKWQQAGEVFAAAVLAIENGEQGRWREVLKLGVASPELERGLISAFGWTPSANVSPLLLQLLASNEPALQRVAVAGYAIRREDPGPRLTFLLRDADPRVRARAFAAAAELGKVDLLRDIRLAVADKDPACQFWAAWSAARLGDRSVAVDQALVQCASQPGQLLDAAIAMRARTLAAAAARQWLGQLWQDPKAHRATAIGVGVLGDPKFVNVLVELMREDAVARTAGEAFSMITGAHLSYDKLERDPPENFETGPTEDPADENVAMDPDENLYWPDPKLVEKWWQANSARFPAGRRYLCGREISPSSLVETLYDGYQHQRAAAALELGLLQPQRPLFEVRARGDWQRQLLPRWFPNAS